MKEGTINELRDSDVINAFFNRLKSSSINSTYLHQDAIIREVVENVAPRFYTSYEYARRFVSILEKGRPLPLKNLNKIKMYQEIHKRYRQLKELHNIQGYSILMDILEQPAPSYYIDIRTFRGILYRLYKR